MGDAQATALPSLDPQPDYTMQGVISFLRSSVAIREAETSSWNRERRQLQERVQALEQRCEAHQQIEDDLIRRIKLLEYALERERQGRSLTIRPADPISRSHQQVGTVVMGRKNSENSGILEETLTPPVEEEEDSATDAGGGMTLAEFFSPLADEISQEGKVFSEEAKQTWSVWARLRSHLDGIRAVDFSPSGGMLVSASDDASLKLWNIKGVKTATKDGLVAADLEPAVTLRGHVGTVTSAVFDPRAERCYSGGVDGTVRAWALPSAQQDLYDSVGFAVRQQVRCMRGHGGAVWSLCAHPRERLLFSAAADATVRVWDTQGLAERACLRADGVAPRVPTCVQLQHGALLAAFVDGGLAAFDVESGACTQLSAEQAAACHALGCHPSLGVVGAAYEDGAMRLLDAASGRAIVEIAAHRGAATCVAFAPSGLYAATGGADGAVRLWDLRQQACVCELPSDGRVFGEGVASVAYHPARPVLACVGASAAINMFIQAAA